MSWERLNTLTTAGEAEVISRIASPYVTNIVYKHHNHYYTVNLYHDWCSQQIIKCELIG